MKILLHKFFIFLLCLFGVIDAIANNGNGPPPPNPNGKKKGFDIPPPGLDIDENIVILIVAGVLLGVYVLYNHNLKTKPSV